MSLFIDLRASNIGFSFCNRNSLSKSISHLCNAVCKDDPAFNELANDKIASLNCNNIFSSRRFLSRDNLIRGYNNPIKDINKAGNILLNKKIPKTNIAKQTNNVCV